mgnify:CR=1 FL=1
MTTLAALLTAPAASLDERGRFLRFLAAGGSAAALNWLCGRLYGLAMPFEIAVVAAYLTGSVWAFCWFRAWAFAPSDKPLTAEIAGFAGVNVIAMALVWLVSTGLARLVFPAVGWTFFPEAIAHGIGIAVPIRSSWFGPNKVSFAKSGP